MKRCVRVSRGLSGPAKYGSAEHKRQLALEQVQDMCRVTNRKDGLFTAFKALARQGKVVMEPISGGNYAVRLKRKAG